jgi:hypothetical protein
MPPEALVMIMSIGLSKTGGSLAGALAHGSNVVFVGESNCSVVLSSRSSKGKGFSKRWVLCDNLVDNLAVGRMLLNRTRLLRTTMSITDPFA